MSFIPTQTPKTIIMQMDAVKMIIITVVFPCSVICKTQTNIIFNKRFGSSLEKVVESKFTLVCPKKSLTLAGHKIPNRE